MFKTGRFQWPQDSVLQTPLSPRARQQLKGLSPLLPSFLALCLSSLTATSKAHPPSFLNLSPLGKLLKNLRLQTQSVLLKLQKTDRTSHAYPIWVTSILLFLSLSLGFITNQERISISACERAETKFQFFRFNSQMCCSATTT